MRNIELSRRGFLKIAGVTGAAGSAGLLGIPSPIRAFQGKSGDDASRLMTFERGTYTPNFCEMCFWGCGLDVYTKDGKIIKIEGNKANPNNLGRICSKGNAGIHATYDPDRIKHPMIRTGKRGEGKWKKVSWDEAFDYIHEKFSDIFDRYGEESLGTFLHGTGGKYARAFTNAIGSPNVTQPSYSQCVGSREIAWSKTFGYGVSGHEIYDMANTKYMISFGRNVAGAVHVGEAERFVEGLAKGAKLVYVDPRCSESAARASRWLQINPGTDMALALGLIHVIMRDNLADVEFVREYCYGYNELHTHVQQYTPEWAEEKTGISAKEIEEIAWEFAAAAPHVLAIPPRRIARYGYDVQTVRAIAILNALMGNVGVPGGQFERSDVPVKEPEDLRPPKPYASRADGAGTTFPFAPTNLGLADALYEVTRTEDPYPIKAWLLYGCDPLGHGARQTGKLFEAMDNVELIVSVDTQFNDSAFYADVVLPESTYLERDDDPCFQKDAIPFIAFRKAAIPPIYDTKSAFDIFQGLAQRFNVQEFFSKSPAQKMEELMESLLPEQAEELKTKGTLAFYDVDMYPRASGKKLHFWTQTQKVQLYVPDFEALYEEHGDECAPMPTYIDPKMPKEGELRLLMGRAPNHSHSRSQNNRMLMEIHGNNPLWINPNDAKELGLKKGDKVKVTNTVTNFTSKPHEIKITDRIKENAVFIHHGFGHLSKAFSIGYDVGISDADFCSRDVDPLSGAVGMNNGFVTIKKA